MGDSLHDWDSKGDFGRFLIPITRSPLASLSLARQGDLIRSKLGWFRKDRLALEDIAGEAWKRLHFRTECEASPGAVLEGLLKGARDLLRILGEHELYTEHLLHDEWGEQWVGTLALVA